MTVLQIAWLGLLTLLTGALAAAAMVNVTPFFIERAFPPPRASLLLLVVVIAAGVFLAVFLSLGVAIMALSVAGLTFGLLTYFLLQRFAQPWDRPGLVRHVPLLFPLMSFSCFVSSMLALGFFGTWYLAAVPFLIWIALGFLSAEIAIQGTIISMRRSGHDCDRSHAILDVNRRQGRGGLFGLSGSHRYPFP